MAAPWERYANNPPRPAKPWERYSQSAEPVRPKRPGGFGQSFSEGFQRSLPETKSLLAGAGAAVAGAVGADGLRDAALDTYRDIQTEEVAPKQNAPGFREAVFGDGSIRDWAGDTLGNFAGQAVQSAVTGLIGAGLGTVRKPGKGTVTGAVGGFVAGSGIRSMIRQRAERMIADQLAKGATREVAEAAGKQAARNMTSQIGGATLATTGLNIAQEAGGTFANRAEDAAAAGETLDQQDALRALGSGVVGGTLDTAAEMLGVGRFLKGASASPSLVRRIAAGAVAGGATEGATEAAQQVISRFGAQRDLTSADAVGEYIDSAAAGALGGGVMGGASGIRRPARPTAAVEPAGEITRVANPQAAVVPTLPPRFEGAAPGTLSDAANAIPTRAVPPPLPAEPATMAAAAQAMPEPATRRPARPQADMFQRMLADRGQPAPAAVTIGADGTVRPARPTAPAEVAPQSAPEVALSPIPEAAPVAPPQIDMPAVPEQRQPTTPPINMDPATGEMLGADAEVWPAAAEHQQPARIIEALVADASRRRGRPPAIRQIAQTYNVDEGTARALRVAAVDRFTRQSLPQPQAAQADAAPAAPVDAAPAAPADAGVAPQTIPDTIPELQAQQVDQQQAADAGVAPVDAPAATAAPVYDDSPDVLETDITPPSGGAFESQGAAELAARRAGADARVMPVDGGFVVRTPAQPAPDLPAAEAAPPQPQPADEPAAPAVPEPQGAPAPSQPAAALPAALPSDPVPSAEPTTQVPGADGALSPVRAAAAEAATSPENDLPQPTQAQKEAGNYKKGHVRINGFDISIENPAGSQRDPKWPPLKNHYGYFKRTVGKDKDHVDVFLTDRAEDPNLPVFVVDQVTKDGKFDEHKVVMGAADEADARATYLANYSPGWQGLGSITQMSQEEFKAWVNDPAKTKRPAARAARQQQTPPVGNTPQPAAPTLNAERYNARIAPDESETATARSRPQAVEDLVRIDGRVSGPDWAAATTIRSTDGRPARIYRGSADGQTRPDDFGRVGAATGHPSAGLGVWFSSDRADASRYGQVGEYYLDIRNPKIYTADDVPEFDSVEEAAALRAKLINGGHDGITFDFRQDGGPLQMVVFRPAQILVERTTEAPQASPAPARAPAPAESQSAPTGEGLTAAEVSPEELAQLLSGDAATLAAAPAPAPAPPAQPAAQPEPEAKAPEPAAIPKTRTLDGVVRYVANHPDTLKAYFVPGRIVPSYGDGQDKVISLDAPAKPGERWSVKVIGVDEDGNPLPDARERTHSTLPAEKDLRAALGPPKAARTAKASAQAKPQVEANAQGQRAAPRSLRPQPKPRAPLFSKAPPIDTPEFKRWFGDSKVADEDGNPLVVYHGTTKNITAFNTNIESNEGEVGTFFTDNPEHATEYGDRLVSAYLSIKKPYEVDGLDWSYGEGLSPKDARAAGYDGYIVRGIEGGDYYIAFRPEQIKSATDNAGTFDPTNPNIMLSKAERSQVPGALPMPRAQELKRQLTKDWGENAPNVVLVESAEELQRAANLPASVLDDPSFYRAEGLYNGRKTVWLNLAQLRTEQRFADVLTHEALGHYGVENVLGAEQWAQITEAIAGHRANGTGARDVRAAVAQVEKTQPGLDAQTFAKEVIAVMAENGANNGLIRRVYAAVRAFLRKIMPSMSWTDTDLRGLLSQADSFLRSGRPLAQVRAQRAAAAFSKAELVTDGRGRRALEMGGERFVERSGSFYLANAKGEARDFMALGEATEAAERVGGEVLADTPSEGDRPTWSVVAPAGAVRAAEVGGMATMFSKAPPIDTPEFKRWFGDSKVVDADGKPLVVYHGTAGEFDVFSPDLAGTQKVSDWGTGVYFTPSRSSADNYRRDAVANNNPAVTAAFERMEKILRDAPKSESREPPDEYWSARKEWQKILREAEDSGGRVIPAYVSLQNPMIIEYQRTRDQDASERAKRKGHDGIIVLNYNGKIDEVVAFTANQIKSATENRGTFDPANPSILFSKAAPGDVLKDIEAVMGVGNDESALQRARAALGEFVAQPVSTFVGSIAKAKDQFRGTWLGALTTRHLTELGSDYFANMRLYADYMAEMGSDRNKLQAEGEELAESVRKWAGKNAPAARALFDLMHESTIDGVDPSKDYQPLMLPPFGGKRLEATQKNLKEYIKAQREVMLGRGGDSKVDRMNDIKAARAAVKAEKRRRGQYAPLVAKWSQLTPEAQQFYRDMRDAYAGRSDAVEDALVARINDTDAPDNRKRQLINVIRQQFETHRLQGVYFPLQRFGQYFVAAERDGAQTFLMFERLTELERAVKDLRARGFNITAQGKKTEGKAKDAPSGTFVADVIEQLKKSGVSETTQDQIYQIYLEALPELSMRKHSIHRKAIPGFDPDAVRAFAFNMHHGAHQLARLRYSHKLQDTLNLLRDQQDKARRDPGADTRRIAAGDAIIEELGKRHEWIMNPTDSAIASFASSLGFVYYLGLTPAAALVNLSQTALVSFPYLASRYGGKRAMNMLLAAGRDSIRTLGNIEKKLTDPEERRAYQVLQQMGAIDKTQAHNLAGIAENGLKGYSPAYARTMEVIGKAFHKTEVVNRETTGIAAFRLARADGKSFDEAVRIAADVINDTHFDYCVDTETQALTTRGWLSYDQIRSGDVVIGVDDEGRATETVVQEVNIFPGKKKVIEFSSGRRFSMAVTPQHDALIQSYDSKPGQWSRIRKVRAEDLKASQHLIRTPLAEIAGRDGRYGVDFAALLGWVAAEGWYAKFRNCKHRSDVRLSQSIAHNPHHVETIRGVLSRIGDLYSEYKPAKNGTITWTIGGKLRKRIIEVMPDKTLNFDMFATMTAQEMAAVIDAFKKGDGSARESGASTIGQAAHNEQNLHVLQAMATAIGLTSTMGGRDEQPNENLILFSQGGKKSKRTMVKSLDRREVEVDTVWCPTTSTGNWVARRRGAVFVTGNSNANRARFMQSGTAKVLLMFRQYSLNMTWHLGRMVWQATKGESPEVKALARRNLAGILGMSALFSGTMGLPMMGVVTGVLNSIAATFGDDDEKWDAETEFRKFLAGMFGETAAETVINGVANQLTGADIAGRVSLSQLWFRDADRELDGRGAYYNLLEQAAGPMGGILKNVMVGKQLIDEGHLWRGVETMLPKAIKDPVKSIRYMSEGVNTLKGDPIMEDLSLGQTLLQLSGFTPSELSRKYDRNRTLKNYEDFVEKRRDHLMNAYAMAVRLGDTDAIAAAWEQIGKFNQTWPQIAITPEKLRQSARTKAMNSARAEDGIVLNPKIAAAIRAQVDGEN